MKKMLTKRRNRLLLALVLGTVIATLACSIAIGVGYYQMNSSPRAESTVNLLGFSIYAIKSIDNEFVGVPNNNGMMVISLLFPLILAVITELSFAKRSKKTTS